MSTWIVFFKDRERQPIDVTADSMYVTQSGYVQFMNTLPDLPVDPDTLCGKPIGAEGVKSCVRVKGHKGNCKSVLGRSRFSPKPRMVCVRLLGSVDDVRLLP